MRAHPLRSLVLSSGFHAIVMVALMLIPIGVHVRGVHRQRADWTRVVLTATPATQPIEWDESVEELEEFAALDLPTELPDDFRELDPPVDLWFDEPRAASGTQAAPPRNAAEVFAELPANLFDAPIEPVEDRTVVVEPEQIVEPLIEAEPPELEPIEPTEAEVAEAESEESPESEGAEEEAATSGDGSDESPLLEAPAPRYPASARAQGKQGTVWLSIAVDATGRVLTVSVAASSGHQVLDEAARQAVLDGWQFRPSRDGEPQVRHYTESVDFRLLHR